MAFQINGANDVASGMFTNSELNTTAHAQTPVTISLAMYCEGILIKFISSVVNH